MREYFVQNILTSAKFMQLLEFMCRIYIESDINVDEKVYKRQNT